MEEHKILSQRVHFRHKEVCKYEQRIGTILNYFGEILYTKNAQKHCSKKNDFDGSAEKLKLF